MGSSKAKSTKTESKRIKKEHALPKPKTHKREFVYTALEKGSGSYARKAYSGEAYELFASIDWNKAWDQWYSLEEDGTYKYRSARHLAAELTKGVDKKDSKQRAELLMMIIGPQESSNADAVPWLGDWEYVRASRFIGETDKESLLFGNPRIAAVREKVKNHIDVLEVAKSIGTNIMLTWLARWEALSTRCEDYWRLRLFDPTKSSKRNNTRFDEYARQQSMLMSRSIDACNEVMKCFGVGKDDIALLTQMMIVSMKGKLDEQTRNVMLASATGTKVMDGMMLGGSVDNSAISVDPWKQSPTLNTMMSTFVEKSLLFKMEIPGVELPGVPAEDTRTDPRRDPIKIIEGKVEEVQPKSNGKAKVM